MRDEEYFAIKERAAAQLLKLPHVNAVGFGGRRRNGQPTGEIVIKVFVTRKKPAHEVPPEELIPESFEGVATDVVEMGPLTYIQTPGAVNPDTREFDLADESEREIAAAFPAGRAQILHPSADLARRVREARYGRELWLWFVMLALLMLVVETLVARWGMVGRARAVVPAS